ncbi:hypothetical protein NA57DRAFT_57980 [Rhizodiscina lignyota]|uniref:WD40 repeat-like protein n=1 Tax=Rhizodiscina lignyota TaxID=1504668 RepID=A0A9P4M520_9PEZI|nr:hypothetical protein NA57DRAFT_57980 [Rhizodiscina lignyota]
MVQASNFPPVPRPPGTMKTAKLLSSYLGSVIDLTVGAEDSDDDAPTPTRSKRRSLFNKHDEDDIGQLPMTEAQRFRAGLNNTQDAHKAIERNIKKTQYVQERKQRQRAGDFTPRPGEHKPRKLVPTYDDSTMPGGATGEHIPAKRTAGGLLKSGSGTSIGNSFTDFWPESTPKERPRARLYSGSHDELEGEGTRLAGQGAKRLGEGRKSFDALIQAAQLDTKDSAEDEDVQDKSDSILGSGSGVEKGPTQSGIALLSRDIGRAGFGDRDRFLKGSNKRQSHPTIAESSKNALRTRARNDSDSSDSFASAQTSHQKDLPTPSLITRIARKEMKANEVARQTYFRPPNTPQMRFENGSAIVVQAEQANDTAIGQNALRSGQAIPTSTHVSSAQDRPRGPPRRQPDIVDLSEARPSPQSPPPHQPSSRAPAQSGMNDALPPELAVEKPRWANRPPCGKLQQFTQEELRKLVELRLFHGLTFNEIAEWYPGRSTGTMATKWNKYLEQNLERWLTPEEQVKYLPKIKEDLKKRNITLKTPPGHTGTPYAPVDLTATPKSRSAQVAALISSAPVPKQRGRPSKPQNNVQILPPRPRGRPPKPQEPAAPQHGIRPSRAVARPENYFAPLRLSREETNTSRSDFLPSEAEIAGPSIPEQPSRRVRRASKKAPEPYPKPYLSYAERQAVQQGLLEGEWDRTRLKAWQGAPLHIDFDYDELEGVQYSISSVLGDAGNEHGSLLKVLSSIMHNADDVAINKIGWHVQQNEYLPFRHKDDVEAFLGDLRDGHVNKTPLKQRLGKPVTRAIAATGTLSSNLRNRELGSNSIKARTNLRTNGFESIGPSIAFTGTSGDVGTVAWASGGERFAAGSACLVDRDSMQYNRPNNLLLGCVETGEVKELAAHFSKREKQETGVNASDEMYATQDPRLFMTVSAVDFSPSGELMYSAGYDGVVRYWDAASDDAGLVGAIQHEAAVDLLAVHPDYESSVIATGCQISGPGSVRIVGCQEHGPLTTLLLSSEKARTRPETRTFPSALRWGLHPSVHSYLLGGFASNQHDDKQDIVGEICLWDISHQAQISIWPNTRNVFDISWSPDASNFAIACVAGVNVNRGIKSAVKLYALGEEKGKEKVSYAMDMECPASDINDVIFSPHDHFLVTVGCTNGSVYMWDIRKHNDILHTFRHGKPLQPLQYDNEREREQLDTGVRFCSWGHDRTRLYSGSSDGVVIAWDPYRSAEDARVRDVVTLDSGVMSGAWSPDLDKLLIGSVSGRVDVLEVGNADRSIRNARQFKLSKAPEPSATNNDPTYDPDSGISAAKALVELKAITLCQIGSLPIRQAVQGPNYMSTPFIDDAMDAPELRVAAAEFQAKMREGDQCLVKGCDKNSAGLKITAEESGDSGRSHDRIPGALREAKPVQDGELLAGKARCSKCNRPARPRLDGATAICERCNFACFRCGATAQVSDSSALLECGECGGVWKMGVLGYELLENPTASVRSSLNGKKKEDKTWKRARRWAKKLGEVDDEQDEYLESMHSLWSVGPTLL